MVDTERPGSALLVSEPIGFVANKRRKLEKAVAEAAFTKIEADQVVRSRI